jgi:predicted peroxiredoxin
MAKLLITTSTGPNDPTKASVPLHIALNGAVKSGTDVAIAFAGDGAEVLKSDVYKSVRGVGIPAMADLMDGLGGAGVQFYV